MSEQSSTSGSRNFLMAALTVMVLGLAWAGWQWSHAKSTSAPTQASPAAAPAEEQHSTPSAPAPTQHGRGEVLDG